MGGPGERRSDGMQSAYLVPLFNNNSRTVEAADRDGKKGDRHLDKAIRIVAGHKRKKRKDNMS